MPATVFMRSDQFLHFDGVALHGTAPSRQVVVTVPARFVSFRSDVLPAAPRAALKAAVSLKAERAFAALGGVAIDAHLSTAHQQQVQVLMAALPNAVLASIRQAATARGLTVLGVRVRELCEPIGRGGIVNVGTDVCLIAAEGDRIRAIAVLGSSPSAAQLDRERMRVGITAEWPACAAIAAQLDFLRPQLAMREPWSQRQGVRVAILAAGVVVAGIAAVLWISLDAMAQRETQRQRSALVEKRVAAPRLHVADIKETAEWFAERPLMEPTLAVLSAALPSGDASDTARFVRVRQVPGEATVVEGVAGDRSHLIALMSRLRSDARVAKAEVRSSRAAGRDGNGVLFEMTLSMRERRGLSATTAAVTTGDDRAKP